MIKFCRVFVSPLKCQCFCYLLHVKMEKKITWHDFHHVDSSGFSNIMIHGKSGFMLTSTLH